MKGSSQIVIYQTEDGKTKLDVLLENETVWLTQKMMAELFQTTVPNVNMHLNNIFEEDELSSDSTIKEFLIVQNEGSRKVERLHKFYNLDVIISIGYRIKSKIATKFRQWATQHIKEYIVKGLVLVDERGQALRRIPMYMSDWIAKLDAFLNINDREILNDAGKISNKLAIEHSAIEYEKFNTKRISNEAENDFDKFTTILNKGKI